MKLLFFLGALSSLAGFAQDLLYKPKNPAFGGDTFNYQWMISSAESQNKFKDKQVERNELTELQQFTQDLNSTIEFSIKIFIATVWERRNIGGELHFW
jgi:curli production assembly/transport component CsgF